MIVLDALHDTSTWPQYLLRLFIGASAKSLIASILSESSCHGSGGTPLEVLEHKRLEWKSIEVVSDRIHLAAIHWPGKNMRLSFTFRMGGDGVTQGMFEQTEGQG